MVYQPRNFISGLKYYVPAMQAGADLGQLLQQRTHLGTPKAAVANGNDINSAGFTGTVVGPTTITVGGLKSDARFGRNVVVKASAATAVSLSVNVYGRDYLGQYMTETITVANSDGTTAVAGLKAFQYIDKLVMTGNAGATAGATLSTGFGAKLGLPYNCRVIEREYAARVAAAAGTLVAAVLTDPQTATTGDPRGTYIPTTTLDGVKFIEIEAQYDNFVNTANRGGLHGIPHFGG